VPLGHNRKDKIIAHVVITWFISPKPPEDLELLLMPGDENEYNQWRPIGSRLESAPGRLIIVVAKLQKRGGGTPEETANSITFKLNQVSHEPGICINFPPRDQCKDQPDLQFRMQDNPRSLHTMVPDPARAVRTPFRGEKLTTADAIISCFDYGAFGLVEATCELESGRQLTAHLKGEDGRYALRLPKSRDGSHIADMWREKYHTQADDASDEDDTPVGDKHKGDGFTLFEEYRGCLGRGGWTDLDPNRKDFFVINNIGGAIQSGFNRFEDLSGIKCHVLLKSETATNVVNFNSRSETHHVDQHAVPLIAGDDPEWSSANGGPGTPKDIDWIDLAHIDNMYAVGSVPHELLHCCNVWHHGDRDPGHTYWHVERNEETGEYEIYPADHVTFNVANKPATSTRKAGVPRIKLFVEEIADQEFIPPELRSEGPVRVWIAVPNGQHSGDENCEMRYMCADAYPEGASNEYVWVRSTDVNHRTHICTTTQGHNVNAPDRLPRPRYYGADVGSKRGNCAFQILVNDAVPTPHRDTVGDTRKAGGPAQDLRK
jgi:hypothetical protein